MAGIDKLVKVTLDKERHLRLTLKGMLEFGRITGKNLLKGFRIQDLTLEDTAAMTFACLLHEDEELTYDKVLLMVDISNLTEVMDAVKQCLIQSLPEAEVDDRPLVKKPQRG